MKITAVTLKCGHIYCKNCLKTMFDTNVMGGVRMVRALLAKLEASGRGHVISIGSIAAIETYAGGAGYNAAKHANRAVMDVLRLELLGRPVRISEIDPGMVETDFSLVRFDGDAEAAAQVYAGVAEPLVAEDVADAIAWMVTRPRHVNVDELVIRPRAQAAQHKVHRAAP